MSTSPDSLDILNSQRTDGDYQTYLTSLYQLQLQQSSYWTFEVVPNQFKQSLDSTDESKFNYLNEDFGKIGQWDDILKKLHDLNLNGDGVYKIFFLARHGQGYHNLAHGKYGDDAWNDYWSKLNGDGTIVWGPDPNLTHLGIAQAKDNNEVWKLQLTDNSLIIPTAFFCSPLTRSIDTLVHTWHDIVDLNSNYPLITENIRETMGVHTCDKRSTKTQIHEKFPQFIIEPGFAEEDIYWKKDYRETVAEQGLRINQSFQQIFDTTKDDIVSITSHSGSIRAQLLVLGHRSFAVGTGGMIPVFVKGTRVEK